MWACTGVLMFYAIDEGRHLRGGDTPYDIEGKGDAPYIII